MATSALDLLIALDTRLDDLGATSMIPGSIPRVRQEWSALARASLNLLHASPRHHPTNDARRLEALLDSLGSTPGEYPLPAPGTGLMAIVGTIGCTAEVMRTRPVVSTETREQGGDAIRASLEAALGRAARWTERGFHILGGAPDPQIVRLAGIDTEPHRSLVLHAWRIIGPTDPGVDGAVSRWEAVATEAITSSRTVTQLALQLASADIALLCASTSAVLHSATQTGIIPDSQEAVAALETAGRSWRQTARWPDELRLGGRTTELRHASADLRQHLDDTLRTGGKWRRPDDMFADVPAEQRIAVLHAGLQAAVRVGRQVEAVLEDLTHGTSRVWLEASHAPASIHAAHMAVDGPRYDWQPDRAGFHSAETLRYQTSRAITGLVHSTPLTIEALTSRTSAADQVGDDEGPWETVTPPLDPLRASQELAELATIFPSQPQAHAISP